MPRIACILAASALALVGGACDNTPATNDAAPTADLAGGDLATPQGGDLAVPADAAVSAGNTGDPCAKSGDCKGAMAQCITKDSQMNVWPGGYCTSRCDPTMNKPSDGSNPACPGMGTCIGVGMTGTCSFNCTTTAECRNGYGCFAGGGCEPLAFSECDPTVMPNTCRQDGGLTVGDGGPSLGFKCDPIGDKVGACDPICDVFAQNCPLSGAGEEQSCNANLQNGLGGCFTHLIGGNGDACMYLNSCDVGLGCDFGVKKCRRYCGGPNNVMPANCGVCKDLSPMVKATVAGLCSM
jgi:hypothetical protein